MSNKNSSLVFGASLKPYRYSNMAIHRLRENGFSVRAIGMREGRVSDVDIDLGQVKFDDIDTVTMYVGMDRQYDHYDYIIELEPRRVIFNPGSENPEFEQLLKENGIEVLHACTLVMLSTKQY